MNFGYMSNVYFGDTIDLGNYLQELCQVILKRTSYPAAVKSEQLSILTPMASGNLGFSTGIQFVFSFLKQKDFLSVPVEG